MPPDDSLPPSRLPEQPTGEQIVAHFQVVCGVRVDLEGLDALSASERLALTGARLPEPPEAHLLDRVLQVVPQAMRSAIGRIVLLDSRAIGRYGTYRVEIVRVVASALHLHEGDPDYGGQYSFFVTTVLHEIGHAVYARWLTREQRAAVENAYLAQMVEEEESAGHVEPTERGVEHYFIDLLLPALLGHSAGRLRPRVARRRLAALGVVWP